MIIAVDFDGTIVEHRYPAIGEEKPFAIETLKMLIRDRHQLILGVSVRVSCWMRLCSGVGNAALSSGRSTVTIPRRIPVIISTSRASSRPIFSSMTVTLEASPTGAPSTK